MKSGETKSFPILTKGISNRTGTGPWRVHVIGGIGRPFTQALKLARNPRAAFMSSGTYPRPSAVPGARAR